MNRILTGHTGTRDVRNQHINPGVAGQRQFV
jgi:hypothetical protein